MHVVVAEQGAVLPGTTAVCGDSHTCTNGALGAIAFGIGSTEIAHAPAYQALWLPRPKTLRVTVDGALDPHVSAKDIALAIISRFSTDGGAGCAMEYAGSVIRALSVEGRMTLCNLSIEFGSRIGLIAPDDAVFSYLHGRPRAPKGAAFDAAVGAWRALASDDNATFDKEYALDASSIAPTVSWGTSPEDAISCGWSDSTTRRCAQPSAAIALGTRSFLCQPAANWGRFSTNSGLGCLSAANVGLARQWLSGRHRTQLCRDLRAECALAAVRSLLPRIANRNLYNRDMAYTYHESISR